MCGQVHYDWEGRECVWKATNAERSDSPRFSWFIKHYTAPAEHFVEPPEHWVPDGPDGRPSRWVREEVHGMAERRTIPAHYNLTELPLHECPEEFALNYAPPQPPLERCVESAHFIENFRKVEWRNRRLNGDDAWYHERLPLSQYAFSRHASQVQHIKRESLESIRQYKLMISDMTDAGNRNADLTPWSHTQVRSLLVANARACIFRRLKESNAADAMTTDWGVVMEQITTASGLAQDMEQYICEVVGELKAITRPAPFIRHGGPFSLPASNAAVNLAVGNNVGRLATLNPNARLTQTTPRLFWQPGPARDDERFPPPQHATTPHDVFLGLNKDLSVKARVMWQESVRRGSGHGCAAALGMIRDSYTDSDVRLMDTQQREVFDDFIDIDTKIAEPNFIGPRQAYERDFMFDARIPRLVEDRAPAQRPGCPWLMSMTPEWGHDVDRFRLADTKYAITREEIQGLGVHALDVESLTAVRNTVGPAFYNELSLWTVLRSFCNGSFDSPHGQVHASEVREGSNLFVHDYFEDLAAGPNVTVERGLESPQIPNGATFLSVLKVFAEKYQDVVNAGREAQTSVQVNLFIRTNEHLLDTELLSHNRPGELTLMRDWSLRDQDYGHWCTAQERDANVVAATGGIFEPSPYRETYRLLETRAFRPLRAGRPFVGIMHFGAFEGLGTPFSDPELLLRRRRNDLGNHVFISHVLQSIAEEDPASPGTIHPAERQIAIHAFGNQNRESIRRIFPQLIAVEELLPLPDIDMDSALWEQLEGGDASDAVEQVRTPEYVREAAQPRGRSRSPRLNSHSNSPDIEELAGDLDGEPWVPQINEDVFSEISEDLYTRFNNFPREVEPHLVRPLGHVTDPLTTLTDVQIQTARRIIGNAMDDEPAQEDGPVIPRQGGWVTTVEPIIRYHLIEQHCYGGTISRPYVVNEIYGFANNVKRDYESTPHRYNSAWNPDLGDKQDDRIVVPQYINVQGVLHRVVRVCVGAIATTKGDLLDAQEQGLAPGHYERVRVHKRKKRRAGPSIPSGPTQNSQAPFVDTRMGDDYDVADLPRCSIRDAESLRQCGCRALRDQVGVLAYPFDLRYVGYTVGFQGSENPDVRRRGRHQGSYLYTSNGGPAQYVAGDPGTIRSPSIVINYWYAWHKGSVEGLTYPGSHRSRTAYMSDWMPLRLLTGPDDSDAFAHKSANWYGQYVGPEDEDVNFPSCVRDYLHSARAEQRELRMLAENVRNQPAHSNKDPCASGTYVPAQPRHLPPIPCADVRIVIHPTLYGEALFVNQGFVMDHEPDQEPPALVDVVTSPDRERMAQDVAQDAVVDAIMIEDHDWPTIDLEQPTRYPFARTTRPTDPVFYEHDPTVPVCDGNYVYPSDDLRLPYRMGNFIPDSWTRPGDHIGRQAVSDLTLQPLAYWTQAQRDLLLTCDLYKLPRHMLRKIPYFGSLQVLRAGGLQPHMLYQLKSKRDVEIDHSNPMEQLLAGVPGGPRVPTLVEAGFENREIEIPDYFYHWCPEDLIRARRFVSDPVTTEELRCFSAVLAGLEHRVTKYLYTRPNNISSRTGKRIQQVEDFLASWPFDLQVEVMRSRAIQDFPHPNIHQPSAFTMNDGLLDEGPGSLSAHMRLDRYRVPFNKSCPIGVGQEGEPLPGFIFRSNDVGRWCLSDIENEKYETIPLMAEIPTLGLSISGLHVIVGTPTFPMRCCPLVPDHMWDEMGRAISGSNYIRLPADDIAALQVSQPVPDLLLGSLFQSLEQLQESVETLTNRLSMQHEAHHGVWLSTQLESIVAINRLQALRVIRDQELLIQLLRRRRESYRARNDPQLDALELYEGESYQHPDGRTVHTAPLQQDRHQGNVSHYLGFGLTEGIQRTAQNLTNQVVARRVVTDLHRASGTTRRFAPARTLRLQENADMERALEYDLPEFEGGPVGVTQRGLLADQHHPFLNGWAMWTSTEHYGLGCCHNTGHAQFTTCSCCRAHMVNHDAALRRRILESHLLYTCCQICLRRIDYYDTWNNVVSANGFTRYEHDEPGVNVEPENPPFWRFDAVVNLEPEVDVAPPADAREQRAQNEEAMWNPTYRYPSPMGYRTGVR